MPLIEKLPQPLKAVLSDGKDGLIAAFPTDLTLQGTFGEEWFVLAEDWLRVYQLNGAAPVMRLELSLAKLKSPSAESLIGGGAMLATVDGQCVEIIRYSNAKQRKFSRIAKHLADVVKYRDGLAKAKDGKNGKDAEDASAPKEKPKLEEDKDEEKRCPACQFLLQDDTKVCPACLNKGKVLLRILAYLKPYWKATCLVWALMFLGIVANLVPPYLMKPLTDKVLTPKDSSLTVEERLALLGWLVLALLAAQAAGQFIGVWRGRLVVSLSQRVAHGIRTNLYAHLQLLSLRFFDKRKTGAMIARVIQDTRALEQVLDDGVQFFVVNILLLLGIGAVLFAMNWRLALWALIPMPMVLLLSRVFWKRLMNLWHRTWHFRSRLSATVNDSLSGVRVVKAFAKESQEIKRFNEHSTDLYQAEMSAEQTWHTIFPILSFIIGTSSLLVWYVGGQQILYGENKMTLGTLFTFQTYLLMFHGPMQFLSRLADYLARALTSSERVFEILDTASDIKEAPDAVPLPHIEGRVQFKDVTFGYEKHKPVLHNITLDVTPGEMIGLVGKSGAGKSTTINLLCRFYEIDEGQLCIDGIDIRKIRQYDLRSQIGVVLQDTFLFNGSIAENIGYAKPGAAPEEIMAAAKAANAHDFIVSKTDGYDTKVGERGQALSGGERQRIAIARAILHNPRILILDEATAAVDTDTEKQIQEAIARLVKGRTTFAIAHRLSTLRNANRLVVLKEGKVIESGTHEELLNKKGEFSRLVGLQQEMAKIVEVGSV